MPLDLGALRRVSSSGRKMAIGEIPSRRDSGFPSCEVPASFRYSQGESCVPFGQKMVKVRPEGTGKAFGRPTLAWRPDKGGGVVRFGGSYRRDRSETELRAGVSGGTQTEKPM